MSVTTPGELRARNLRTLAALAALFLLPLALAFFTYYGTAWRPGALVSHGCLISPARPLPAVALRRIDLEGQPATETADVTAPPFRKRWSLVYLGAGDCDAACRDALYVMRQTRLALNTDMTQLAAALGVPLGARILLLDPAAPFGYVRAWQPPGLAPLRHFSYAVQWWSFALATLVLWVIMSRRPPQVAAS